MANADNPITTLNLPKIPEEPDVSRPLIDYLQSLEHILRTQLTGAYQVVEGDIDISGNLDADSLDVGTSPNDVNIDGSGNINAAGTITVGTDVTATGNVTGANLNVSNWDTAYGWGDHSTENYLKNIVEDTTPQLGGNLDGQSNNISTEGTITVADGSANVVLSASATPNNAYIIAAGNLNLSATGGGNEVLVNDNAVVSGTLDVTGDTTLSSALDHDGSTVGFYNTTPVSQPSAYTQTYSTADKTLSAYTGDDESVAYTGIDNAQGGTPYAQLTDLNALRTAYETLRAFAEDTAQMVNSIVDDLQALGLVG